MADGNLSHPRVRVDGKFFRVGERKFHLKGVTYGPFAPNAAQEPFPSAEQAARDFQQARELGANLLRVYHVPPRWFLDLAAAHELKLLIDVPWAKNHCFLEAKKDREAAREAVREAVRAGVGHSAVFAIGRAHV